MPFIPLEKEILLKIKLMKNNHEKKIIDSISYLNMITVVSFVIGFVVFLFFLFDKGMNVFKYPDRLLKVFGIPILVMIICKYILYLMKKNQMNDNV
jgi:SNF family Na+-dependent transporter